MGVKLESTIISWKLRASNLIGLVESEIKHKQKMIFKQLFKKKFLGR